MQPSDRSERLRELEFINSLVELLRVHPAFHDVDPAALRSSATEARALPDITCYRGGVLYVIECKSLAPAVQSRIDRYIRQLARLRETYSAAASVVLAIPEPLQDEYKAAFREKGFEVWDISVIAEYFGNYAGHVGDPTFRELLAHAAATAHVPTTGQALRERLRDLPCGRAAWSAYQRLCVDIVEYLFVPPLGKPLYESSDEPRINRRDIILPNYADGGFWLYMRQRFVADYIVIDAKNYCEPVKKKEVLQVANYVKHTGAGMFGMICTRSAISRAAMLIRREQWTMYAKMIVFLGDQDLTQMLTLRDAGDEPEQVIRQRIEEFRLSL
jgi:hypothetical protein